MDLRTNNAKESVSNNIVNAFMFKFGKMTHEEKLDYLKRMGLSFYIKEELEFNRED